MSDPIPTQEELQTCYEVLEMVRDHHDETGLVQAVNLLNEAHSVVHEFEQDHVDQ